MSNKITEKQKLELGLAIRRMRKLLKKHQSEIAYAIGTTQPLFSSWELGKTFPEKVFHSSLIRFAREVGVFLPHLNENKSNMGNKKLIQIFYKSGVKDIVQGTVEEIIHLLNTEKVFVEVLGEYNKKIIINKNEILNIKEIQEYNNDK